MLKILVIGDNNTGKTSIVNRYARGKFSNTYKATIACEFALKIEVFEDTQVRVQLWDIAG